ncbi:LacI family DNA-binding transcriptional regulator [Bremerella sp. P1]|uniref:LacI family DNA-binding transcriptional regulator n=1 Tax=Bremerella sp. P1 TaxID=3026424 RepID=UPI002367709C|nr:LacI family DNA-binding transcriptional regulator [Bremerella sp. P1]WDI41494.1 LacI family DNA-binding transcriptional regulator [Bremerella sp. P1]
MTVEFGRPKRVRLVDIAEKVGVSRRAVSAVLLGTGGSRVTVGEEKAKEIQRVANSMGYQPNLAARQLVGKRSHTFGLLVASAGDPLRSFLIQYLDEEAAAHGNRTLIGNTVIAPDRFDKNVQLFTNSGVDGVLCAVHNWLPGDRTALLNQHPCTVFYEDPGIPNACFVTVDRVDAVRQATDYLIEQGRERIGLALTMKSKKSEKDRLRGFKEAQKSGGQTFSPNFLFYASPKYKDAHAWHDVDTVKWSFPEAVIDDLIERLVVGEGADAIIAHDDYWAATLIKRLRYRGVRVPDDVAVVGYLNHYLADFTDPPLTTIDLDHMTAAKEMVSMLERMIGSEELPADQRQILIKPRLIVRESA